MEHILFLTGRLAHASLVRVLEGMAPTPFTWAVHDISVQVAGLMTADMIRRRLPQPLPEGLRADRILVPGRCRGDLAELSQHFGLPVERGPEELKDIPQHFNRAGKAVDLSAYETRIFAEIVDAPRLSVAAIVERATQLRAEGADVIDLGCLPATAFNHLEDSVKALKGEGFTVSVDSMDSGELLRGGKAGADYLLSLNIDTLWICDEVAATPVIIPRSPSDEASLEAAIAAMRQRNRPFLADPILDPLPFGFTDSIVRYHGLRQRHPDIDILIGVGNVTELTEADTAGMNALLLGIAAELRIAALLTTQVSGHARRAVREADHARRIMYAARENQMLAKGLSDQLLAVHEKQPFPDTPEEIAVTAAAIKDKSFRIQVAQDGVHVYNRELHQIAADPFALWPQLGLEADGSHAFYMGVELARAQVAWQLGKRYSQDQELRWGCAANDDSAGPAAHCAPTGAPAAASTPAAPKIPDLPDTP